MNDVPTLLRAALADDLPSELAEVLMPHLTVGPTGDGGVLLGAIDPLWAVVVREHVLPVAQRWLTQHAPGTDLRLMASGGSAPMPSGQTFDGFLADPGNQLALAACHQVAMQPGLTHNPLYLHGPSGVGKSHLLAALAAEIRSTLEGAEVVALSGAEFVASAAQELARRSADGLRGRLDTAVAVLIDGVDALDGRDLAQEELFHLINAALDRGTQLVFTAREPPRRIPGLTERLTSRLAWGLTVRIDHPHLETRVALVRRLAGPAAGEDLAALTGTVEAFAPDMHQAVALAGRLRLGERPRPQAARSISFDRIVQVVAAHFQLRPGDLTGKRRHAEVVIARGLALLLARRLTGHSLTALGGMVGGRDHTTVLNALRSTESRLSDDPALRRTLDVLNQAVME